MPSLFYFTLQSFIASAFFTGISLQQAEAKKKTLALLPSSLRSTALEELTSDKLAPGPTYNSI